MKRAPRRLWFRAKDYGWGWVPVTWEGWLVTFLYCVLMAVSSILFLGWLAAAKEAETTDMRTLILGILEFLAFMAVITGLLLRICYRHGELPSWRWGRKDRT